MSAIPDSNPTRAQLRLVVLGQWVKAGLALARSASAGRGVIGGGVALWQIFQAVRLAILLAQRLSELQGLLSRAVGEKASGGAADGAAASVQRLEPWPDDSSGAAWLRHAQDELTRTMREVLGFTPPPQARSGSCELAGFATEPKVPQARGRLAQPRERPPDRPPGRARWRSSTAAYA